MESNKRLKSYLSSKKISQKDFASDIDSTQQYVSALLNGKRKIGTNLIERIKEKFEDLNISWLLTGEGSMLRENKNNSVLNEPPVLYNSNGNKYTEVRDGVYNIEAQVIQFEAYASYAESLETGTVQEDFDTEIFRVDRIGRGNYKAFIVKGDSMNGGGIDDTKDGATVLARELGRQHWKDGFKPTEYGWIILCKENIFHKDIVAYDAETGDITLHSRNKSPEYSDFTINLNDCYQIFKVIKRTF